MALDPTNQVYFELLQKKAKRKDSSIQEIKIAGSSKEVFQGKIAYSTAIADKQILNALPTTKYESLSSNRYEGTAKQTILLRRKMYAGLGTSIERRSHLEKNTGNSNISIGAKGTDLFIEIPHPIESSKKTKVSLAEVQILQGLMSAKKNEYKKITFEDLVSTETVSALDSLWNKKCLLNSKVTYKEYVENSDSLSLKPFVTQANLPTYTEDGKPSNNRLAPGGHGFFGIQYLLTLLGKKVSDDEKCVSFISNGEDLSAYPDPKTVGWMIEENIPLCMVVTEKTVLDKKGGQLAIVMDSENPPYVILVETAQAKASGKLQLFEDLGLTVKENGQSAYFNTNLALFNETILHKNLIEIEKKIGKEKLIEAIAPDIIQNWKEQIDTDGVKRKYLQVEGAMGSVYLNLDKLSREVLNKPLVHFLLVSKEDRAKYFAPVKTAFDLFLQYYSSEYEWDKNRLCPIHKKPGKYPNAIPSSDDVESVLLEFKNKELSSYFL